MKRKQIPLEAIISLRQRLEQLPPRSPARGILMKETASVYGVSVDTLYRALRERRKPKSVSRSDRGKLRKLTNAERASRKTLWSLYSGGRTNSTTSLPQF